MTTHNLLPDELDLSLVRGGSLYSFLIKIGVAPAGVRGVIVRVVFFVCLTWLPLFGLSWLQGRQIGIPLVGSFLANFSESIRFLVVVPLLLFAEMQIQPWLSHVVRYFVQSGLIPDDQTPQYLQFVKRSQHLNNSIAIELAILCLAFVTSAFGLSLGPGSDDSRWIFTGDRLTMAGAWFRFVAMPICRFLWLRWAWRVAVWWALLARVSTLRLRLVATHPDCEGGLGFLASGHNNFSLLIFAFSCQLSSILGQQIVYHGHSLYDFKGTIFMVVVLMVLFGILPLLVFTPKLMDCKRKGLFEYGILAKQHGDSYHSRWVQGEETSATPERPEDSDTKVQENFAIVGNMHAVAFDRSTLLAFSIAAAIPFAPLIMTVYRFDQLLDQVVKKII